MEVNLNAGIARVGFRLASALTTCPVVSNIRHC
jgi:hypothetical protein